MVCINVMLICCGEGVGNDAQSYCYRKGAVSNAFRLVTETHAEAVLPLQAPGSCREQEECYPET